MIKNKATLAAVVLSCAAQSSYAFTIDFDYSIDTANTNFFGNATAKANLEAAGQYFSNLLTDDLDAVEINTTVKLPGVNGYSAAVNMTTPEDHLTVFVGGDNIGGTTAGIGGSSWFLTSGSRGEAGHPATDFAPWYGRMSFDNDGSTMWYFDPDTSTDEAFVGTDFFSVALHELGHVLGLGAAPSWDNLVNTATDQFSGPNSVAVNGGLVALEFDESHWLNGTTSTINGIGSFEAAMDPIIINNTRKRFTDLDIAALKDVGWQVVPIPAAVWLFGSGLLVMFGLGRKQLKTNRVT